MLTKPKDCYFYAGHMLLPSILNIYILSVVALDKTKISGCLHFSMQNIEMSCDLDHASMRSNVNISQWYSLFKDVCVMSLMYRQDIIFTSFSPWLFIHLH